VVARLARAKMTKRKNVLEMKIREKRRTRRWLAHVETRGRRGSKTEVVGHKWAYRIAVNEKLRKLVEVGIKSVGDYTSNGCVQRVGMGWKH